MLCYETICGSGSQIMAGEKSRRRVYAMQISQECVDVAVERSRVERDCRRRWRGEGMTLTDVRVDRLDAESPLPRLPKTEYHPAA